MTDQALFQRVKSILKVKKSGSAEKLKGYKGESRFIYLRYSLGTWVNCIGSLNISEGRKELLIKELKRRRDMAKEAIEERGA